MQNSVAISDTACELVGCPCPTKHRIGRCVDNDDDGGGTIRKSLVVERSLSLPLTLNDLERRERRGQIFRADFHNHAQTVCPGTTKFVMITRVAQHRVSRGQALAATFY